MGLGSACSRVTHRGQKCIDMWALRMICFQASKAASLSHLISKSLILMQLPQMVSTMQNKIPIPVTFYHDQVERYEARASSRGSKATSLSSKLLPSRVQVRPLLRNFSQYAPIDPDMSMSTKR